MEPRWRDGLKEPGYSWRDPEKETQDFRDLSTLQRPTRERHAAGLPLRARGLSGAQELGLAGRAPGQGGRVRIYHPYY